MTKRPAVKNLILMFPISLILLGILVSITISSSFQYYFLLISSWLCLFLGPILILIAIWGFLKRRVHKALLIAAIGGVFTSYALYFWMPEIERSKKDAGLRKEEIENTKNNPQDSEMKQ